MISKNFLKEQIQKVKTTNIDTYHIELVQESEKDEILHSLSLISKEDNEIDSNLTKIVSIVENIEEIYINDTKHIF